MGQTGVYLTSFSFHRNIYVHNFCIILWGSEEGTLGIVGPQRLVSHPPGRGWAGDPLYSENSWPLPWDLLNPVEGF